jgi:hypothetical protein
MTSSITVSGRHQTMRLRPSSLNLEQPMPALPSRSISFNGSASSSSYQLPKHSISMGGLSSSLRRQSGWSRRVQRHLNSVSNSTNSHALTMKLLSENLQCSGGVYRNNRNHWRDSWTLLDNPLLDDNVNGSHCHHRAAGDVVMVRFVLYRL